MVLPVRLIRDVCDLILGLPPQGCFVVAFAVIICGWFHCNILRISVATHWWNLQYHSIERVTSDCNPVLSSSLPISSFQWISRQIHLAFVAFFQPSFDWYSWSDSSISRMGDLCHLDKWFRTIGPCVLWFRIWHIQQMKKSDVLKTVTENVWMDVLLTMRFVGLIWESRFYL